MNKVVRTTVLQLVALCISCGSLGFVTANSFHISRMNADTRRKIEESRAIMEQTRQRMNEVRAAYVR